MSVTLGRTTLIHNERAKLFAGFLNTLAAAAVTAGILAPLAARMYGVSTAVEWLAMVGLGIWFALGIFLHAMAQRVLGVLL